MLLLSQLLIRYCSFNRYMVECELNVYPECMLQAVRVLIDTWWNVNVYEFIVFKIDLAGFNRYMVECECVPFAYGIWRLLGFNRYMVECECVWTIGYGHTGKEF